MDISGISAIASSSNTSDTNTNNYMDKFAEKVIAQKDIDNDGCISIEEAKLPKEIFSLVDKDGNDKIDKDELKAAAGEIQGGIMSLSELLLQSNRVPAPEKMKELLGGLKNSSALTSVLNQNQGAENTTAAV